MDTREWVNFGGMGLVLGVLLVALWRIWLWVRPKLDQFIDAHIELLQTLQKQMVQQTEVLKGISSATTTLIENQAKFAEHIKKGEGHG